MNVQEWQKEMETKSYRFALLPHRTLCTLEKHYAQTHILICYPETLIENVNHSGKYAVKNCVYTIHKQKDIPRRSEILQLLFQFKEYNIFTEVDIEQTFPENGVVVFRFDVATDEAEFFDLTEELFEAILFAYHEIVSFLKEFGYHRLALELNSFEQKIPYSLTRRLNIND